MTSQPRLVWRKAILIAAASPVALAFLAVLPAVDAADHVGNRTRGGLAAVSQARPLNGVLSQDLSYFARGRRELPQLAVWNLRAGTRVTLTATGPSAPAIAATLTAPASGFVDLSAFVRGVPLPPATDLGLRLEYQPPGAPGEAHAIQAHLTVQPNVRYPVLNVQCSTTTPTFQSTACYLPCPRPAGIALDYCKGIDRVVHFRAAVGYRPVRRRGVKLTSLVVQTRTAGTTLGVYCYAPGFVPGGRPCPFGYRLYPGLGRRRIRLRKLAGVVLPPGTIVDLHIYKDNYVLQRTRLLVRGPRARSTIRLTRSCRYPDGTDRACPPAPRRRR